MNNESETKTIVVKRDGREVEFDLFKIQDAIKKSMSATKSGIDQDVVDKISYHTQQKFLNKKVNVEDIQDFIERQLMNSTRKDAAKEYIKYRQKRNIAREAKVKDVFMSIINAENNEVTRENANMNADTPAGEMMKFASESTKPFVDNYLLSEEVKDAVGNNYIHIHDKDYFPTKSLTCLQHPLDKILSEGFKAGHGEARPAKRIETASILACISMESIQNEMHK